MEEYKIIATSAFGLSSSVKREAINLGFKDIKTFDDRVEFLGAARDICRANLYFRCAGRVLVKIAEFEAHTFDELFEGTKAIDWAKWIPVDGKFTITGKSVKSDLASVPDCQSIVKKAIVERLKKTYSVDWFDETGAEYPIEISMLKNKATLTINSSGSGLHKRGYRENAKEAPIRETLAASMIELSYWNKNRILLDPLCGSGTIPIEAALIARNIAPGLNRKFVSEAWEQIGKNNWKAERVSAYKAIDYDHMPKIYGSDMDSEAIEVALENAKKAGVDDCISFSVVPCEKAKIPGDYGVLIANPPYGERLGDVKEVEDLYRTLGNIRRNNPTWSVYVITAMEYFETLFGEKASSKRKLFNGRIKVDYYMFDGPRPPIK